MTRVSEVESSPPELSVNFYRATRCNIPEGSHLHLPRSNVSVTLVACRTLQLAELIGKGFELLEDPRDLQSLRQKTIRETLT